jgi:hypothetical protein
MVRDTVSEGVTPMSTISEQKQQAERLADDLLIGARSIAEELGVAPHVVYYLASRNRLPIGRIGKNLIASRSKLRRAALALAS